MRIFAPITKVDQEQRMVFGYASTEALDRQGEIIRKEAVEAALPEYMRFGNIREMHQPSAVGVAKTAQMDDRGLYLGVKVVDEAAWTKVREGVYTGFSIGGEVTKRDTVQKHVVTGCTIAEISLVDRPANPEAVFEMFKAHGLATPLAKIGARNSKVDLAQLQSIHDAAVGLGAACSDGCDDTDDASDDDDPNQDDPDQDDPDQDDAGKAASIGTLRKRRGKSASRLAKAQATIEGQAALIDQLGRDLAALRRSPAPAKGVLRAIGKNDDAADRSAPNEAEMIKADPLYLIKQAQKRPISILS
ncbi:MAG TPA: XkdF-like putative serine protease domain-containing protein [Stellaceae bacterium]|nr:XkdF-like putative serine protease domain-containing protein [Stellaceae bacterium]